MLHHPPNCRCCQVVLLTNSVSKGNDTLRNCYNYCVFAANAISAAGFSKPWATTQGGRLSFLI